MLAGTTSVEVVGHAEALLERDPTAHTDVDQSQIDKLPDRIQLFDVGLGADNLLNSEGAKLRIRFSVINLTNKEALYNFLSTFSGTHFVTPRAYQVQVGVTF